MTILIFLASLIGGIIVVFQCSLLFSGMMLMFIWEDLALVQLSKTYSMEQIASL